MLQKVRAGHLQELANHFSKISTRVLQKVLLCTKYYVISYGYPYLFYSYLFKKVSSLINHEIFSLNAAELSSLMHVKALTSLTSAVISISLN